VRRGCAASAPVIGARTFFPHGPNGPLRFELTESSTIMTDLLISTQAAAAGGGAGGWLMLVPYLLIFLVFYMFLIRPQQVRMKQHRAKIDAVKVRDQVVTAGGVVGKVTKVDTDYVDVEIATGVKVKVVKSTLADIILPGGKPAND
jgi:preprotein translocase subunit YajC